MGTDLYAGRLVFEFLLPFTFQISIDRVRTGG